MAINNTGRSTIGYTKVSERNMKSVLVGTFFSAQRKKLSQVFIIYWVGLNHFLVTCKVLLLCQNQTRH